MASINTPGSGHAAPAPTAGWQWQPYADAGFLAALRAAVQIIDNRIKNHQPCNSAFRALPGGRTFAQVWNDNSIWISCDPSRVAQRYGATLGNEVTVTAYSLAMGRWTVAATLIHELAHVNGAGGGSRDAENTLLRCLLHGLHDPNIIGQIIRSKKLENPVRQYA